MGYVQSHVDSFGKWTKSGSDIYLPSGNVGIGAAPGAFKLDVSGAMKAQSMMLAKTSPTLEIRDTGFTNAQIGKTGFINFTDSTGTQSSYIGDNFGTINALMIATTVAEPIYFQTNGTDRMGITTGGYVGVGTLNPSAKNCMFKMGRCFLKERARI